VFKAVQTYDSGEVVRWIEEAAEGAEEPEHPAPVLNLTPPAPTEGTDSSTAPAADDAEPVAASSDAGFDMGDGLGAAALIVALAAAVLAALALRRRPAA
jgi:hypothetical protein